MSYHRLPLSSFVTSVWNLRVSSNLYILGHFRALLCKISDFRKYSKRSVGAGGGIPANDKIRHQWETTLGSNRYFRGIRDSKRGFSGFSNTSKAEQWRNTSIINATLGSKIGEPVISVIGYYVWHLIAKMHAFDLRLVWRIKKSYLNAFRKICISCHRKFPPRRRRRKKNLRFAKSSIPSYLIDADVTFRPNEYNFKVQNNFVTIRSVYGGCDKYWHVVVFIVASR